MGKIQTGWNSPFRKSEGSDPCQQLPLRTFYFGSTISLPSLVFFQSLQSSKGITTPAESSPWVAMPCWTVKSGEIPLQPSSGAKKEWKFRLATGSDSLSMVPSLSTAPWWVLPRYCECLPWTWLMKVFLIMLVWKSQASHLSVFAFTFNKCFSSD